MLSTVQKYASLVRFAHTVFALPFALIGFFYAVRFEPGPFEWGVLVKVLLCMVFARNAAMGFNRYADRKIDALNPRTRCREIPSGKIAPRQAAVFTAVNAVLFVLTAWFINRLAFVLSPVALAVILGYSLTKRFTFFCHIFIGLALSIAPTGAYIAVTGKIALVPLLLSALVLTWASGFDIIYSLQDAEFDRRNGINSMPARIGIRGALAVSSLLHVLTVCSVALVGLLSGGGTLYWIGAGFFVALLIYQHLIVSPKNLSRIGLAFGTVNGVASVLYAVFMIAGFYPD